MRHRREEIRPRLTHHVHILEMNGESFRLATAKKAQRRTGYAPNPRKQPAMETTAPKTKSVRQLARASRPFSLLMHSRRHLAHFVSAIDTRSRVAE